MRQLSKQEQTKLMWDYHSDAGLQLIYPTFALFVEARTGVRIGGI
jgi:hypothetical protein